MRTLLALLLLCASTSADDFQCQVLEAPFFEWTIGGDRSVSGKDVTDSGVGQVSETPSPESLNSCVQSIEVYHGGSADIGSAVHIGEGMYLTCKHVFTDDYWRPWKISSLRIAGRNVEHDAPRLHPTLDVAVVQTNRREHPSVQVGVERPETGTPLTVIGAMTDVHYGAALDTKQDRMIVQSETHTTNGDSGAPVFNSSGCVVGVQSGSLPGEIYFTPLKDVAALVAPFTPAAVSTPAPAADSKPKLRINIADFPCPPCETLKGYDWSEFDVEWVTGGAPSFPQISWLDSRGVRRVLTGAYSPGRVKWSYRETLR